MQFNFRTHIEKLHGEYHCGVCPDIFPSLQRKNIHLKTKHTCKICHVVVMDLKSHSHKSSSNRTGAKRRATEGASIRAKIPREERRRGHRFSNILYDTTYQPNSRGKNIIKRLKN